MSSLITARMKRELDKWPQVKYSVQHGGRHPKLYVAIGARQRMLVLSGSPSDHRADLNNAARIRRALTELARD